MSAQGPQRIGGAPQPRMGGGFQPNLAGGVSNSVMTCKSCVVVLPPGTCAPPHGKGKTYGCMIYVHGDKGTVSGPLVEYKRGLGDWQTDGLIAGQGQVNYTSWDFEGTTSFRIDGDVGIYDDEQPRQYYYFYGSAGPISGPGLVDLWVTGIPVT